MRRWEQKRDVTAQATPTLVSEPRSSKRAEDTSPTFLRNSPTPP